MFAGRVVKVVVSDAIVNVHRDRDGRRSATQLQATTIIAGGGNSRRRHGISNHRVNPAWRFLLPLFGVWLLLYGSYALLRPPLPDGRGTMHAEIAREMVARHDWSTAYVNGVAVKSPSRLVDWTIAVNYKLFGVADWSARLPNALCVLALATIAFFFGRKLFLSNAAGLYAALIILVWPGTFVATRGLTPVPLISAAIALAVFALWHLPAIRKLNVLWSLLAWAALACLFGHFFESQPLNPLAWLGPVLPLALLIAGSLANREPFADRPRIRRLAYTVFAVGILISAALIFIAIQGPTGFSLFTSSLVLVTAPGRIPYIILAAAFIAGVTGNLVYRLHRNPRAANCFLAGLLAGITVAIQAALVVASPERSSQILADAIRPELDATDIVVVDGKYPEASSFAFYLERPVLLTLPQGSDLGAISGSASEAAAIDGVWSDTKRVYLWTRTDHPLPVPGQSYVIAASGGKEILSNQPNSGGASF